MTAVLCGARHFERLFLESPAPLLNLIGPPRLVRPDAADVPLESKDAALLALLALEGTQPRARLAALLWPDVEANRARANLRQRLLRLRRTCACALVEGVAALRLPTDLAVDVHGLPEQVRSAPQRPVVDLLAGHEFDDTPELADWLARARAHHRDTWCRLLAERADALEQAQEWDAALPAALVLLGAVPLEEATHRRLMRLHHLRGDRAAALAAYARCEQGLRRELGVAPGAETEALRRLIDAGASPAAPSHSAVVLLRPPVLLGRDAEWQQLQRAHAARQCVLLVGEAGIGKTRLTSEFVATHGPALVAGARPGDEHQPYALFVRLLRRGLERHGTPAVLDGAALAELARLLPELGAAADGALIQARLAWAARQAFHGWAERGLALVVLDDVHFADDASLALLLPLAGKGEAVAQGSRLTWLLASRAVEMPAAVKDWAAAHASHELRAADAAASSEPDSSARLAAQASGLVLSPAQTDRLLRAGATVEHIVLGPLAAGQVRELIESLRLPNVDAQAWAPALARHTGGNPLFVLQTLSASLDAGGLQGLPPAPQTDAALPLPRQVGRLIEQRLARLSPQAQRLARLAAVAGQSFSVDLAAAVLQVPVLDVAPAWHELEEAQILRDEGFAHDLIFEATLHGIPAAVRRSVHAQVATALQAANADAAVLADHWWAAQRWREAADAFRLVASQAQRLAVVAEEARGWQRVVDALVRLQEAQVAGKSPKRGPARRADDLADDAADEVAAGLAGRDARRASDTGPDALAAELFDCRWQHWNAAFKVEPFDAQVALCKVLEAEARNTAQQARASLALAMLHNANFKDQPALLAADRAMVLARQHGDAELELAGVRQATRALSRLNRPAEAVALVERHLPALLVDGAGHAEALVDFAAALIVSNDSARAMDLLVAAGQQATRRRDLPTLYEVHIHQGWALMTLDQLERSTHHYEEARALLPRLGACTMARQHGMALARQYRALGRYGEALVLLDETLAEQSRSADNTLVTLTRCEQAVAFWQLGQQARVLQALGEPPPDSAAPSIRAAWLLTRSRCAGLPQAQSVSLVRQAIDVIQGEGMEHYRAVLGNELAIVLPPEEGLPVVLAMLQRCRTEPSLVTQLRTSLQRSCDLLLKLGRAEEALLLARELEAIARKGPSDALSTPVAWWTISRAYAAADCPGEAQAAWQRARDWIVDTALPNVPPEFHHGFLHVNAVNRAILTSRVVDLT